MYRNIEEIKKNPGLGEIVNDLINNYNNLQCTFHYCLWNIMIKCFTDICVHSKNAFFGASDGLCFLLPSFRTRSRCARRAVQTSNSIEGSGQTIRFFFEESVICPLRSSHQTDTQHRFFNGEVQLIF